MCHFSFSLFKLNLFIKNKNFNSYHIWNEPVLNLLHVIFILFELLQKSFLLHKDTNYHKYSHKTHYDDFL